MIGRGLLVECQEAAGDAELRQPLGQRIHQLPGVSRRRQPGAQFIEQMGLLFRLQMMIGFQAVGSLGGQDSGLLEKVFGPRTLLVPQTRQEVSP